MIQRQKATQQPLTASDNLDSKHPRAQEPKGAFTSIWCVQELTQAPQRNIAFSLPGTVSRHKTAFSSIAAQLRSRRHNPDPGPQAIAPIFPPCLRSAALVHSSTSIWVLPSCSPFPSSPHLQRVHYFVLLALVDPPNSLVPPLSQTPDSTSSPVSHSLDSHEPPTVAAPSTQFSILSPR